MKCCGIGSGSGKSIPRRSFEIDRLGAPGRRPRHNYNLKLKVPVHLEVQ